MELKHESINLFFPVRRALNATCSILIIFFPAKVTAFSLQAFSGKATFSLPPRPGYLKVPIVRTTSLFLIFTLLFLWKKKKRFI